MNKNVSRKPLITKTLTTRDIIKQGKVNYPNSRSMRHQWVRKTITLLAEEKHILYSDREEMWKLSVLKK